MIELIRAINFIERNPDVVVFNDQDALNAVIDGRWKSLPLKYNVQAPILRNKFLQKKTQIDHDEVLEARSKPVVIHFTGSKKPWYYKSTNPYQWMYWKYLAMTPFKEYKAPDKTAKNFIMKNFRRIFKKNFLEP